MCSMCDEFPDEADCEFCGGWRNVQLVLDPFLEDRYNQDELVHICDDCYQDRMDEI